MYYSLGSRSKGCVIGTEAASNTVDEFIAIGTWTTLNEGGHLARPAQLTIEIPTFRREILIHWATGAKRSLDRKILEKQRVDSAFRKSADWAQDFAWKDGVNGASPHRESDLCLLFVWFSAGYP